MSKLNAKPPSLWRESPPIPVELSACPKCNGITISYCISHDSATCDGCGYKEKVSDFRDQYRSLNPSSRESRAGDLSGYMKSEAAQKRNEADTQNREDQEFRDIRKLALEMGKTELVEMWDKINAA